MSKKMGRGRIVGAGALVATAILGAGHASAQNTTCGGPGLIAAPDLAVGVITGPANYTAVGTLDALSLGTTSCNMGNTNVQWNACNSVTHPVIGGNLYRLSTVSGATRFEQVGMSWLKHAFTALTNSDCCACNGQGGSVLGVGCSDPYTAGRNGTQSGLGPRGEVNAFTGTYASATCGHHPSSGNAGRLEVLTSDLVATTGGSGATTRYFGESQYINHDDAIWSDAGHAAGWLSTNNASYIEISVSGTGTDKTFGFFGATVRFKSAIQAWKTIDPTVTETPVTVPGEGKFFICSKATSLGGGLYHYEYAVYNMNSDRSGGSFIVPIDDSITASNVSFHDVTYRGGDGVTFGTNYDGTDWPSVKTGGQLSWSTTPFTTSTNANAIRWGTTYNFRFDAAAAPVNGNVTLGLYKTGSPASVSAAAVVPGAPIILPPPTNVQADPTLVCDGGSTLLSATVPVGQVIDWYSTSCGGVFQGTGGTIEVTPAGTGSYYARARVVANGMTSASCSSALVTVGTSPSISQQPAPANVNQGSAAGFSVTASGNPAVTYQWRKDTVDLVNGGAVSGATTASLTIDPAMVADSGGYDVVITNSCNSVTSTSAQLTVVGHCGSADFNHDGDVGTDADIDAFFACLSGSCCAACDSADFNADGDLGTDADIEAFFRVLGGGTC